MIKHSIHIIARQLLFLALITGLSMPPCLAAPYSALFENAVILLEKEGLLAAKAVSRERLSYLKNVNDDPGYALTGVRLFIERRLSALAKYCNNGLAPARGTSELLSYLQLKKVLSPAQTYALAKFNTCLNEAAHNTIICDQNVKDWIENDSPKLIGYLDELLTKHEVPQALDRHVLVR